METANILARKNQVKFKELFNLAYFKPLGVSIGLMFIQQFSGINAVMFYSVSIFRVKSTTQCGNFINFSTNQILREINYGRCQNFQKEPFGLIHRPEFHP